jgi:uncharacterized protein YhhL (DUF1145 family)
MEQTIQALDATFARFVAFLPTLLGALVVLIVGWIVAILLGRLADTILERLGFDSLIHRGKVHETLQEHGSSYDPSRIVGAIVFWAALITTFLLTANILGLTGISELLTGLVAFLPYVAVAAIALVVAVALAQIAYDAIIALIGDRVEGAQAIASAAKWGIIAFGIFMALSQLQIAPVIVNGLFLAFVGAIALAFAISFGWGNIELAKEITEHWYRKTTEQAKTDKPESGEEKGKRPAA